MSGYSQLLQATALGRKAKNRNQLDRNFGTVVLRLQRAQREWIREVDVRGGRLGRDKECVNA